MNIAVVLLALSTAVYATQTIQPAPNPAPANSKIILDKDYYSVRNEVTHLTAQALPQLLAGAQAGDVHAQLELGMGYQLGVFAPHPDAAEALKWYHAAADQGSTIAADQIGVSYDPFEGFAGVKGHDPDQALKWYRQAAEHNDAVGQYNMGALLAELHREPEAVDWYVQAGDHGFFSAFSDLIEVFQKGKALPGKNKQENRKEGLALIQRKAGEGNAGAQYELGLVYQEGWLDLHSDRQTALGWYRKAAEQDMVRAEYQVGLYHFRGFGVPANKPEGLKWLLKAADNQNPNAQLDLAFIYEKGDGVPQDFIEGYKWYYLAQAGGAPGTQFPKNAREAGDWIHLHHHLSDAEIPEVRKRLQDWRTQHGLAPKSPANGT